MMSFYDLQYFNIYSIMLVLICETKFFGLIFFVKLSSSQQIQPNLGSLIWNNYKPPPTQDSNALA